MIVEYTGNAGDPGWDKIVQVLFDKGILRKVETHVAEDPVSTIGSSYTQVPKIQSNVGPYLNPSDPANLYPAPSDKEKYLMNGMPIEANIKKISDEHIGFCEDKTFWVKDLKTAVKEHGHDEVLSAFYDWSSSQTGFLGKKPISAFLKNASANIGMAVRKPSVTNVNLDKVEKEIAYYSENAVFFGGDYKMRLAVLIKDHGPQTVVDAFKTFFQDVEPRSIPFAAKNFLERAELIINTMVRVKYEEARQQALLDASFKAAKNNVTSEPEEEEADPL